MLVPALFASSCDRFDTTLLLARYFEDAFMVHVESVEKLNLKRDLFGPNNSISVLHSPVDRDANTALRSKYTKLKLDISVECDQFYFSSYSDYQILARNVGIGRWIIWNLPVKAIYFRKLGLLNDKLKSAKVYVAVASSISGKVDVSNIVDPITAQFTKETVQRISKLDPSRLPELNSHLEAKSIKLLETQTCSGFLIYTFGVD